MANKKISELTALGATPDPTDVLPVVDTDATTTKKVTISNLMGAAPVQSVGGATGAVTLTNLSLENVDNTSDANKPVSTAQQTALDLKAPLDDPAFTTEVNIAGHLLLGHETYNIGSPTALVNEIYLSTASLYLGTDKIGVSAGGELTFTPDGGSALELTSGGGSGAAGGFPGFGTSSGLALEGDTALLAIGTSSSTALAGDTTVISGGQATAISANTAKVTFPGFGTSSSTALVGDTALLALGTSSSTALAGDTALLALGTSSSTALAGDTALLALGTSSSTALAGDTTTITGGQATAISANTAKVTNATHTGDAAGDTALTLATVNSNVGAFTNADITVNAKGLVTAAATGSGGGGGATALDFNDQTSSVTAYTLQASDLGKVILIDSYTNTDVTVTIAATSVLGAGFYCWVQLVDANPTGSFARIMAGSNPRFVDGAGICLSWKGAIAKITNVSTDVHQVTGDISNYFGCRALVATQDPSGYLNFDDTSANIKNMSGYSDWNSTNSSYAGAGYGKITGEQMTGNYKLIPSPDYRTEADSALSSSGASEALAHDSGGSHYGYLTPTGLNYQRIVWMYCGTGNTVTAVTTTDESTTDNAGNSGTQDVDVVPFIYGQNYDYYAANQNSSYKACYGFSLYFDGSNYLGATGEPNYTGSSYSSYTQYNCGYFGDSNGIGSAGMGSGQSYYGGGAQSGDIEVYMYGFQSGQIVDAGSPYNPASNGTPEGMFYTTQ